MGDSSTVSVVSLRFALNHIPEKKSPVTVSRWRRAVGADVELATEDAGGDVARDAVVGPVGGDLGPVAEDAGYLGLHVAVAGYVQLEVQVFLWDALKLLLGAGHGPVDALADEGLGPLTTEATRAHAVEEPLGRVGFETAVKLFREGGRVSGEVEGGGGVIADGDVVGWP